MYPCFHHGSFVTNISCHVSHCGGKSGKINERAFVFRVRKKRRKDFVKKRKPGNYVLFVKYV